MNNFLACFCAYCLWIYIDLQHVGVSEPAQFLRFGRWTFSSNIESEFLFTSLAKNRVHEVSKHKRLTNVSNETLHIICSTWFLTWNTWYIINPVRSLTSCTWDVFTRTSFLPTHPFLGTEHFVTVPPLFPFYRATDRRAQRTDSSSRTSGFALRVERSCVIWQPYPFISPFSGVCFHLGIALTPWSLSCIITPLRSVRYVRWGALKEDKGLQI